MDVVYTSFSVCTEIRDGIWRGGLQCDPVGAVGCSAAGVIAAGYYCTGPVGVADTCIENCGIG
jgi:hypothetical protein